MVNLGFCLKFVSLFLSFGELWGNFLVFPQTRKGFQPFCPQEEGFIINKN